MTPRLAAWRYENCVNGDRVLMARLHICGEVIPNSCSAECPEKPARRVGGKTICQWGDSPTMAWAYRAAFPTTASRTSPVRHLLVVFLEFLQACRDRLGFPAVAIPPFPSAPDGLLELGLRRGNFSRGTLRWTRSRALPHSQPRARSDYIYALEQLAAQRLSRSVSSDTTGATP